MRDLPTKAILEGMRDRIVELRKQFSLSQIDFSEALGAARMSCGGWEAPSVKNRRNMQLEHLIEARKKFGVDLNELICGEKEQKVPIHYIPKKKYTFDDPIMAPIPEVYFTSMGMRLEDDYMIVPLEYHMLKQFGDDDSCIVDMAMECRGKQDHKKFFAIEVDDCYLIAQYVFADKEFVFFAENGEQYKNPSVIGRVVARYGIL